MAHGEGTGVLVLGEPTLQQPVTAMIQGWLEEHGQKTVGDVLDKDAQNTFVNCFVIEDVSCARGVFEKRAHADSVIYVSVELKPSRKGRQLLLTAYSFVRGHDAIADKRSCADCDDKALNVAVEEMMSALAKSSGRDKGRIALRSKPSGLVVMLDGVKIGVTPVERDLDTGPHQVQLVENGRVVATKAVTVGAGAEAEIELSPSHDVPIDSTRSRVLPAIVIGAGVAAAAAGGTLLYYGHKGGYDEPYVYSKSTTPGLVLSISGGALVIVGIVLAVSGRSGSGPTASINASGGSVGWAGSF